MADRWWRYRNFRAGREFELNSVANDTCLADSLGAADTCRANAEQNLAVTEAISEVAGRGETEVDFIAVVSNN